jgi:hypothetical protein
MLHGNKLCMKQSNGKQCIRNTSVENINEIN